MSIGAVAPDDAARVREIVDRVYRDDSRRVLATLIRLFGDFDIAEEALHDAFVAAIERWPVEGVPVNPRTWLVSAGRFGRSISSVGARRSTIAAPKSSGSSRSSRRRRNR